MMKKIIYLLFNHRSFVIYLLLIQIVFICWLILVQASRLVMTVLEVLSFIIVVYVINRRDKGAYKIAWIVLMLTLPLFGGLLYLMLLWQVRSGQFRKQAKSYDKRARSYLSIDKKIIAKFNSACNGHERKVGYLCEYAGFPLYDNTKAEYLPSGEVFFARLKKELYTAEAFIFIEYFIIDSDDRIWCEIEEVLHQKAMGGVDVRVIYDDMGCFGTVPEDFKAELERKGIKSIVFNRFRPLLTSLQNNRDHRKIAVIDGKTAFTGGINLADEYINEKQKFGHWIDSAILVQGEAVRSFTVMFLQMWNAVRGEDEEYSLFFRETGKDCYRDGYIQPFCDTPTDDENICEHIYMQILNNAREYVYIQTPYLIVDDSMLSAFILAAKSGVDIRIMTPGVPDKRIIHMTTRSYYPPLIEAGVRIYEYTPGFIHSKVVVSDDTVATVGTANFDFRSMYLHYECGALIFNSSAISDIKESFISLIPKCKSITKKDTDRNPLVRLGQSFMRIIAPLL